MKDNHNSEFDIGTRIRALRKIRGITLKQMSEDTGMSYSYLSELENNKHSVTVDNLKKLAVYFGIDMIHFLEKTERKGVLVRKEDRSSLKTKDGMVFQTIPSENVRSMQITFVTLPPDSPDKSKRNIHKHPQGEEFITVTKGEVIVVVEEEKYLLKEGDSLVFPADREHIIYSGEKGGEFILIGAPPYGREYLAHL